MKDIIVIGGPNGAGKTTMAMELLPDRLGLLEFVNADHVALGLSPFNPDGAAAAAGRIMIERMRDLARAGRSFAFETTCAGRGHARFLRRCRSEGWRVTLLFLWLNTPEIAIRRVARRVAEGGHDIPRETIVRRYWGGLRNLTAFYLPLADTAQIYDNSEGAGVLIADKSPETGFVVHDIARWTHLERDADERPDGS